MYCQYITSASNTALTQTVMINISIIIIAQAPETFSILLFTLVFKNTAVKHALSL